MQLVPLSAVGFEDWRDRTRRRMIRLRQDSGLHPGDDAATQTQLYFTELLPDGLLTHTSRVLQIVDEEGVDHGSIWMAFASGRLFLIDVAGVESLAAQEADKIWALVRAVATAERVTQISAGVFPGDASALRLLDGRGFVVSSIEMLLESLPERAAERLPERPDADPVSVVPMSAERYPRFAAASEAGFAAELAASGRLTVDEAAAEAQRQFAKELPDGLDTPGQELFTASVAGEEVGVLWLGLRSRDGRPHVFVLDIEVASDQRRRGYGRALMHAAEREARRLGSDSIGLHVFGFNGAAVELYEQLGYRRVNELRVLDC